MGADFNLSYIARQRDMIASLADKAITHTSVFVVIITGVGRKYSSELFFLCTKVPVPSNTTFNCSIMQLSKHGSLITITLLLTQSCHINPYPAIA